MLHAWAIVFSTNEKNMHFNFNFSRGVSLRLLSLHKLSLPLLKILPLECSAEIILTSKKFCIIKVTFLHPVVNGVNVESWNKGLEKQKYPGHCGGVCGHQGKYSTWLYIQDCVTLYYNYGMFSYLSRHPSHPWKMELRCIIGQVKSSLQQWRFSI